jgi:hypothetical protein
MEVEFGPDGEIARISAPRHRDVAGKMVLTPWRGEFGSYRRVHGMMTPGWSQVGWIVDDVWQPYWRGRNVHSEFEFA